MNIRLARATAVCALVVTVLGAATLAFASSASASTPCWKQILNQWTNSQSGFVSPNYPLRCYRDAIAHVPADLSQYSSIEEDILAARQQAARRGDNRTPQVHVSPSQSQNADPESGLYKQAVDSLGPANADSMPLPLLILAGLSLILMTAGGAGLVTRRVRARKVPS